MSKRIVDVHGDLVYFPNGYDEALQAVVKMIDNMESEGVDRSDMSVALSTLMAQMKFHLNFLPKRVLTNSNNPV